MKTVGKLALGVGALAVATSQPGLSSETPSASIAHITTVTGTAMVSKESGMFPALAGMQLEPLNRIFVLEDSSATIEFGDGCRQELPENAILTLDEGATCTSAESVERQAVGLAEGTGTSTQSSFAAAAGAPRLGAAPFLFPVGAGAGLGAIPPTAAIVAGGALVTGGVIWAATDNNNNNPPAAQTQAPPPRQVSP